MSDEIQALAASMADRLVAYRRDFHRYPESGWTEFRTSAVIAGILRELGYNIRLGREIVRRESMMGVPPPEVLNRCMERAVEEGADRDLVKQMEGGLTGVVAEVKCGDGPVLALRFDIDANDINEAEDVSHRPYRESFHSIHPGVMHACGHDGHIAMGLGVAELLVKLKEKIQGTVRIVFQPAEEGVRGARAMVDAGVVDGVDYILGGHLGFLAKKNGELICGIERFLATTKFDVTFSGLSAHAGSAPEEGRNALLAAASCALNLHAIPRHGEGASRVTVGRMEAGQGRNVIPPNALIQAETRGETTEINEFMFESACRVISGAAAMYGVEHEITLMGQGGNACSDREMVSLVKRTAEKMDCFNRDDITDRSAMGGSEDFSSMLTRVQEQGGKGTYFVLGTELAAGHHDSFFDFDEGCLAVGVELIVGAVLELLG